MKLCTFEVSGARRLGAVTADGKIMDVEAATGGAAPADMLAFLRAGDPARRAVDAALNASPTPDLGGKATTEEFADVAVAALGN